MKRKPRSTKDGIFSRGLGIDVLYQGALVTLLTLAAYFVGANSVNGFSFNLANWQFTNIELGTPAGHLGTTMAFLTMSMCEIFHSLNMRSQRGSIFTMAFMGSHNILLYGSMIAILVLTTFVIELPFLAEAFDFSHFNLAHYGIALAITFLIIPIVEIVKAIQRAAAKK